MRAPGSLSLESQTRQGMFVADPGGSWRMDNELTSVNLSSIVLKVELLETWEVCIY